MLSGVVLGRGGAKDLYFGGEGARLYFAEKRAWSELAYFTTLHSYLV